MVSFVQWLTSVALVVILSSTPYSIQRGYGPPSVAGRLGIRLYSVKVEIRRIRTVLTTPRFALSLMGIVSAPAQYQVL